MDNLRLSDFLRRIVVASVAYAMAKSVLVACAMAAAPAERSKNLIENGEFAVKGDAERPDGWAIVAPNEALRPKFTAEKNSNGNGALVAQGNGRKECFGYARHPLHLTGGKTYRLQVRFRFEGFEDVNRHLVHAIHSPTFNEGVFEYRREGDSVIGERSFTGPAKDGDAEMRLYYRFSPAGKVVWQSVTLEECEPLAARPVKIAVSSGWGDMEHWSKFLDAAGERGADIALLPEFCNVCKADSNKPAKPESLDGPTAMFMAAKAKQWKMYVAGTFARRDGDLVYNSAPLFDRQGKLVGVYDKNLLFDPELEHGTTPGVGYPVFKTDFGKVAIMTCYDSWFPEPARLVGYKGAELVLLPNAGYYRELMPARSADNGVAFAVSSLNCPAGIWDSGGNQAGRTEAEETHFAPRDAIKGFEKLDDMGMVLATIDLSKRPSPHYWGGPMLSAPGGRRVRFTWREPLEEEIARESRRWDNGSASAATSAAVTASAANPAKSNAAELLRQRVLSDYPRLRDEKLSDWERVGLLRQWAWSHVNLACTKSNLVDCDPRIPWRELDAAGIFQLFGEMRGGVFCGGTSRALAELYKLFGYEAWMVNSGSTGADSATHVITLVRIQDKGQSMLSMQDAYFNLAYADAITGAPLDYFEMLKLLAQGKHASVTVVEPDHLRISPWPVTLLCAKDRGNSTPQQIARGAFSVLEAHYSHEELPDGSLKLVSPRTAAKFLADQCHDHDGNPRWYFAWLREQGHPLCINYLFLYPLGIEGRDSDAMMKRAMQITGPVQNPAKQKSAAAVPSIGPPTN